MSRLWSSDQGRMHRSAWGYSLECLYYDSKELIMKLIMKTGYVNQLGGGKSITISILQTQRLDREVHFQVRLYEISLRGIFYSLYPAYTNSVSQTSGLRRNVSISLGYPLSVAELLTQRDSAAMDLSSRKWCVNQRPSREYKAAKIIKSVSNYCDIFPFVVWDSNCCNSFLTKSSSV